MPAASRVRDLFGYNSVLRDMAGLLPSRFGPTRGPTDLIANGHFGGYLCMNDDPTYARIRIDLYWPGVDTATISRLDPDGQTRDVRGGDPALMCVQWARWDYEAPLDTSVSYQASSSDRDGVMLVAGTVSVSAGGRHWLKSPLNPALNMKVTISDPSPVTLPDRRGVLRPPQRPDALVVYQIRGQDVGDGLELYAGDATVEAAIRALLADGSPLLFQAPSVAGGVSMYISVGPVKVSKRVRPTQDPQKVLVLPFDSIARFAGDAAGGPSDSYDDVAARYRDGETLAASGLTNLEVSML